MVLPFPNEKDPKGLGITNTKTEGLSAQNLVRLITLFLLAGAKPKTSALNQELIT